MRAFLSVLTLVLATSSALAADFSGAYKCDDGGELTMQKHNKTEYSSYMTNASGMGNQMIGIYFSDDLSAGSIIADEPSYSPLGVAVPSADGNTMTLKYHYHTVVCFK